MRPTEQIQPSPCGLDEKMNGTFTMVNILADSAPLGFEEISNYPKNEEELRVFYC